MSELYHLIIYQCTMYKSGARGRPDNVWQFGPDLQVQSKIKKCYDPGSLNLLYIEFDNVATLLRVLKC